MPIRKNDDGVIVYTPKSDRFETETTGVHPADSFFICDNQDQLKQLGFDLSSLAPGARVIFKMQNITSNGDIVLTFPSQNAEIGTARRLVIEKVAAESISAMKLVYSMTYNSVGVADYMYETKVEVLGLALTSALPGETLTVLTMGEVTDPFFDFELNQTLYLGLNGAVTDVVPTTGFLVEVGNCSGENTINMRVDRIIKL